MPAFVVIYFNAANSQYEVINGPNSDKSFTGIDGTDANGLAALQSGKSGKFVAFSVPGAAQAQLQTSSAVNNANLLFTAVTPGVAGNNIRVRYNVAGNNTALSVSSSGNDITVNNATNGSGVATSTAAAIRTALNANGTIAALMTTTLAPGNDGTGVPLAMGFTNLSGGNVGAAVATNTTVAPAASSVLTSF